MLKCWGNIEIYVNGKSEKMGILPISVVIPTMNRVNTLKETLQNIEASSFYPEEIIIVDQSTDDKICEEIKNTAASFSLNICYYHRVPSLTKARNFGIEKVKNDIVVFMDDDVNILQDTMINIHKIMQDNTISMIAGLDLNAGIEKSKMGYLFGKKSYKRRKIGHVAFGLYGRLPQNTDKRVETEWAMGFFFVVRKSLVDKWNLKWEEQFISYGYPEDLDFSHRYYIESKRNGLKCIVDPKIKVYHMVSKEWRETSWKVTYMQVINREYLTYKWELGFKSRILTRWSNFGLFVQRLLMRDNCLDVLKAQWFCDLHRKDIRKGNLHTEIYLK